MQGPSGTLQTDLSMAKNSLQFRSTLCRDTACRVRRFQQRKIPLETFHRNVSKPTIPQTGHRAERSCSLRPRKAVAFLTHLLRAPKSTGAESFAVCGQRLRGHVPSKNSSPAALSWSSLMEKRFHNAFFFSPAFFCLAFPVETWDFFENPGFPPPLHRKFPVFHTVFHKLWKTHVEKKFRRRKRFPGCVFCRCGISCGGLCKGVSTGCGNRCRHLPDFPRISPQVFRFHSTIFPPFHPQKISPLLHDFSTKGSWKKNLRRFRQKYGFPLFLPLYNCY